MVNNLDNIEYNEILEFNGHEEEFKKYIEILKEPLEDNIIYYDDKEKMHIKYKGNIINGQYEGRGILYDYDGNIKYNGFFVEGNYESFGKEYKSNELLYEGYFKNNLYNGKGILYNKGKIIYNGYFKDGYYNGIGIEYFNNGNRKRKMKYEKNKPLEKCYGILYDDNNNEIYRGLLINKIPDCGKSVTIYDNNEFKIYKGDFLLCKYHGKGILYFEGNNKIYFNGIFNNGEYLNGIIYEPDGKKIYEGEFKDKNPKEGQNIKLYEINGFLKYEGDFFEFNYDGNGKLYEKISDNNTSKLLYEGNFKIGKFNGFRKLYKNIKNKHNYYENSFLLYEGEFKEGYFNGLGKFYGNDINLEYEKYFQNGIKKVKYIKYYLNEEKYYEGNFKNNEIFGYGIKFYKTGKKKIEGIFNSINYCEGKYYSPENIEIYNGKIINEIPNNSNNIILYDDEEIKIYEGTINNYEYSKEGIEYSNSIKDMILYKGYFLNNYCIYVNSNLNFYQREKKKKIKLIKIIFVSDGDCGKTSILQRIIENNFPNKNIPTLSLDFRLFSYEYNNNDYKLQIWDSSGKERYRNILLSSIKGTHIFIFFIDLSENKEINVNLINWIKEKAIYDKKTLFYLVGNKLDIGRNNVDKYRKEAKILIDNGIINKYFEVSAKTGEGIEMLLKNLKIDAAVIIDNLTFCNYQSVQRILKNISSLQNKDYNKLKKLYKYYNV